MFSARGIEYVDCQVDAPPLIAGSLRDSRGPKPGLMPTTYLVLGPDFVGNPNLLRYVTAYALDEPQHLTNINSVQEKSAHP
ncbi:hypothetical protein TNCV_2484471 [Trichonephila clavipes]|uniref:Uncharacterized protein n=1 Tax=Trichonephila clavipes TaxID=2585209 RepID=A0A8X6VZ96_TRICX|nr:hypothetical protein TNCV_2484471 [Trichonephila clavipes]